MNQLSNLYWRKGKYADAEPLLLRALEGRRRLFGSLHPSTIASLFAVGRFRLDQQRYVEAESLVREALNDYEKLAPDAWPRFHAQYVLGVSLTAQHRYSDAEPLVIAGYEGLRQRQQTIPASYQSVLQKSADAVLRLYEAWGKSDKTLEWREKLNTVHPGNAR
jgi:tetratricopeptide (TPR) repeat protein